MTSCASFTRENGFIVFQSTPYRDSNPKRAGDHAFGVLAGQLVEGCERLADERRLAEVDAGEVGSEATFVVNAARGRAQGRLCQVSSAA